MLSNFIRRPVLSLVISLIIVLVGLLALVRLPVTQFPDIVPPSVVVTANYNGANADVCTNAVAVPLERAINGVPGMTYMNTVSTNNGTTQIEVFFEVGTDPDQAAVNVQNRVTTVLDELPEEVIRAGVKSEKSVNSMLLYLNVTSTDKAASEEFIYNFTDINILQELKRIEGVGLVDIMGAREYSMRVWLKPDRLLAYNISTEEIVAAMRRQNVEAAPGVTGENSGKDRQSKQYVLKYTGKFNTPEQYRNLVLRADQNGSLLRLKDIADVEFGTVSYDMVSKTDGRPSASIMIKQRPGSNAREVIANIKDKMKELKATTFPPGMEYSFAYDVSRFLDASIHEVLRTLAEAFLLVFLVVFIFLQNFRATLIPALAVPVALIGTLACMQAFGFSINMLTLFALVLAIGIVVDNAIVVVEAVHVKMERDHLPARQATEAAMKEIAGAIVAITLVMSAVFVPVAFLSGPVGVFYRQFSLTLAMAIAISGINALTLTPALCALLLKHHAFDGNKKVFTARLFSGFNRVYDRVERGYGNAVSRLVRRRLVTLGLLAVFCAAIWAFGKWLPDGFIPSEDQSMVYVNVTTPPGSTVDRTEEVLEDVQLAVRKDENIDNITTLAGYSLLSDISGASYGMMMINLKDWNKREASIDQVMTALKTRTAHISDATVDFFAPPAVPGFGNAGGFEFRLLNKNRNTSLTETAKVSENFLAALRARPAIGGAFTSFDPNFPQYLIHVDQDMAAKHGVSIENAMETLQTLLGSYYATNFIRFGQMYKVMLQALPESRANPEDVLKLFVKNDKGEMVPYSNFIAMEKVFGPEQITRYNMYTAAMMNGDAAPGYSSGQAIRAIREVADSALPRGFTYEWSGMTREQIISGNQAATIFLICLVFVYLLLAAQYESFLLPLAVILSLPAGVAGAFGLLLLTGLENNIYAQVALIMLIGLLGKNAILIVEIAVQERRRGVSLATAAKRGAVSRLRPILMTSFAFIAGLIPLCFANGAGAMGNRSIGTAAAGGMLAGTIFGIFLVPGLFVLFSVRKKRRGGKSKAHKSQKIRTQKNPAAARTDLGGVKPALGIGLVLFVLSSCSVMRPAPLPAVRPLPAAYPDSSGMLSREPDTAGRVFREPDTVRRVSGIPDTARLDFKALFPDTNLHRLIESGLQNNTDLSISLERIAAVKAKLFARRGAFYPTLGAAARASAERYGDYTQNGVGNFDTNLSPNIDKDQKIPVSPYTDYFLGLVSNWELDLWGKLRHAKRAAAAEWLASVEGRRWLATNLVAGLAHGYYDLLKLDAELAIVRRNIGLQENALEIVEAQKAGGRATELAVQQFRAQLLNTRALEFSIRQARVQAENDLNELAGNYPGPIARDTVLPAVLPPAFSAGVPASLLAARPDIRQAEQDMRARREDVLAARAAFLPSLTINPFAAFNAFRPSLLFRGGSAVYGAAGSLTAPLFQQNQIRAAYRVANAENRAAVFSYQQRLLAAYNEVSTNLRGMENFRETHRLKTAEFNELQAAVASSRELYLTGYANYLEVITAQKNALDAELELAEQKKNIYVSAIGLYRSLGGGWN